MSEYTLDEDLIQWATEISLLEPESNYSKEEKAASVSAMRKRTKALAVRVVDLVSTLEFSIATRVIGHQLVKSATSTGANYRAACVARSKAEFRSKISISLEEADETIYWLEVLYDSSIKCDKGELDYLIKEFTSIAKILSRARGKVL